MLYLQCSPLSSVDIWLLNSDYILSGSYSRKTVFSMFLICNTETTHANVASSKYIYKIYIYIIIIYVICIKLLKDFLNLVNLSIFPIQFNL